MRILKLQATLLAVLIVSTTGALAQRDLPIDRPNEIISRFSPEVMSAFFAELQISIQEHTSSSDLPFYVATLPSGAKFMVAPRVVDEASQECCMGVDFFRFFEAPDNRDMHAAANSFNGGYPFAKVFISGHNRPVISRYIIADGGVTRANLFYNLTNFLGASQSFIAYLAQMQQSVSAPQSKGPSSVHGMNTFHQPLADPTAPRYINEIELLVSQDELNLKVLAPAFVWQP